MDHPCGKCLRWPECNGVDWGSCPPSLAYIEKENAPTAMAAFLTGKQPAVSWGSAADEKDKEE